MKLPTDKALLDDPAFRPYVELYAKVIQLGYFSKLQGFEELGGNVTVEHTGLSIFQPK